MKQRHLALLIAVSMLAGYKNTSAQYSSVARVDAGGDRTLCHSNCFDLNVQLSDVRTTDQYLIDSSISYNDHYPFFIPGSGSVAAVNNIFSGPIPLPFSFCFYGKAYNNVAIGSNGIISFDDESMGKRCEPKLKKEIPSRAYAYAAIMPAYQALDLSLGGSIYYKSEGEVPNRKFIINYNNIPIRSCNSDNVTFQVVLYETTNAIEIYLKDKPSCIYEREGAAICGIQNRHKEGLALPGKNLSRWGAMGMNKAYRFIPAGNAGLQFVQLSTAGGTVLAGTKATQTENGQLSASFNNVCIEGQSASYIISTTYTNCGVATTVSDTINITKDPGCEDKKSPEPLPGIRNEVTAINNDMPEARQLREVTIGRVSMSHPATCQGISGSINLHGLQANTLYTVEYTKNGAQQKTRQISSNAAGAVIISKLSAGIYTDIKISNAVTSTSEAGPYVLKDPELPATPEPGNNGPLNPGDKLVLSVSNEDKVSYTWLGPGLAAVHPRPSILNAQPYNAGVYTVVATRNGCNSKPATTTVAINNKGGIPNRNVPIRLDHNKKVKPMPSQVKMTPSLAAAKQMPKPPPVVQRPFRLSAGSNSPLKAGATLRLHASTVKGATYSWNGPNNFSSNAQNPALNNASTNATGTYTLTVASAQGMLRTAHVNVQVQPGITQRSTGKEEPVTIYGVSTSATDPFVNYGHDGQIALMGLAPSTTYKVHFDKDGIPQPMRYCTTDAQGVLLIMWLTAGNYTNIYVSSLKGGRSNSVSAVLKDPGKIKVYERPQIKPQPITISERRKAGNRQEIAHANADDFTKRINERHAEAKGEAQGPAPVANNRSLAAHSTNRVATKAMLKPAATTKETVSEPKPVEYKGIIISKDNAYENETITVDYTDPIKEKEKIKWDFGGAEIISGSGAGPYLLRWKEAGVKTIYLTLPYNIPNYGYRLQKQVYVMTEPVETPVMPATEPRRKSIAERYAEEEKMPAEVVVSHRKSISERYAEEEKAPTEMIRPQGEPVKKPAPVVEPVLTEQHIYMSRRDICLNDTATIMLAGNVPADAELNWDFASGDIVSGSGAGPYIVRWDENGSKNISLRVDNKTSKAIFNKTINIRPAPEVHFVMQDNACPGEKVLVEIDMEMKNLQQYSWDFDGADVLSGNGAGPYEVKWEQPGKKVVSLTVKGETGCVSLPHRDILTVHDDCCNIAVPSAFTPNGDGKNDRFRVASVGPHMIIRFVIRNRFGREIFSTNDEREGWDGTLNGVPQEIGTYYYQVRYRCGQTLHEKDGEVMLLR